MKKNNTSVKNKNKQLINWKDFTLDFSKDLIKHFLSESISDFKEKIYKFSLRFKSSFFSWIFFILAAVFLFVGLAKILDYFIGIFGLGYIIVSFFILIMGVLVKFYYIDKN